MELVELKKQAIDKLDLQFWPKNIFNERVIDTKSGCFMFVYDGFDDITATLDARMEAFIRGDGHEFWITYQDLVKKRSAWSKSHPMLDNVVPQSLIDALDPTRKLYREQQLVKQIKEHKSKVEVAEKKRDVDALDLFAKSVPIAKNCNTGTWICIVLQYTVTVGTNRFVQICPPIPVFYPQATNVEQRQGRDWYVNCRFLRCANDDCKSRDNQHSLFERLDLIEYCKRCHVAVFCGRDCWNHCEGKHKGCVASSDPFQARGKRVQELREEHRVKAPSILKAQLRSIETARGRLLDRRRIIDAALKNMDDIRKGASKMAETHEEAEKSVISAILDNKAHDDSGSDWSDGEGDEGAPDSDQDEPMTEIERKHARFLRRTDAAHAKLSKAFNATLADVAKGGVTPPFTPQRGDGRPPFTPQGAAESKSKKGAGAGAGSKQGGKGGAAAPPDSSDSDESPLFDEPLEVALAKEASREEHEQAARNRQIDREYATLSDSDSRTDTVRRKKKKSTSKKSSKKPGAGKKAKAAAASEAQPMQTSDDDDDDEDDGHKRPIGRPRKPSGEKKPRSKPKSKLGRKAGRPKKEGGQGGMQSPLPLPLVGTVFGGFGKRGSDAGSDPFAKLDFGAFMDQVQRQQESQRRGKGR